MSHLDRHPMRTHCWIFSSLFLLCSSTFVHAQIGSIPHVRVDVSASKAAFPDLVTDLESGKRVVRFKDAAWLQLRFSEFYLGKTGHLRLRGGESTQTFNDGQLRDWGGFTARFNSSEIEITLNAGSGQVEQHFAELAEVVVGLPVASLHTNWDFLEATNSTGSQVHDGSDDEVRVPESICGNSDDRVSSSNPAVGRIMPVGCTGWIIQGGKLLTAGHCIRNSGRGQTIEFNVPKSDRDGTTNAPATRYQYSFDVDSLEARNTGPGNDWAVFKVHPNTETGLLPAQAQGSTFTVSNTANPSKVTITGYGVDGPPPNFGSPPPQNHDNQTQQTHTGDLRDNTGGSNTGLLTYSVDTQGANSGSPVISGSNTRQAIGIHTNGGCHPQGGANSGTSFRNQALWNEINR